MTTDHAPGLPEAACLGTQQYPSHIAIIMDGNNRWAKQRELYGPQGHAAGEHMAQRIIEHCARRGIQALTLFAFSSENWQRPSDEVAALMELFVQALSRKVQDLHEQQVSLRFIGDLSSLVLLFVRVWRERWN